MDAEITSSPLPREMPRTPVELRPTNMRRSDTVNRVTKPSRVARITSSLSSARRTAIRRPRSEEHTSELQSLMRISYDVFCVKKKTQIKIATRKYQLMQPYK